MLPLLRDLEKRRRKYLLQVQRGSLILIALGCVCAVFSFVIKLTDSTLVPLLTMVVASVFFVMMGIVWILIRSEDSKFLRKYQEVFRSFLIPELLKTLESGTSYSVRKGVSGKAFRSLQFFDSSYDQFHSSDKITGEVEGVSFSISFAHSEIAADAKGTHMTQFQGFFLMMDFHKEFHGRTYVLPDDAERLFGKTGRSTQKLMKRRYTNLLQLDDPEFEKAFVVYSTDEVEARYLLSHSMMKRILKMRKRFGSRIRFSFRGSCVCIAIPTGRNYLIPRLNRPSTDEAQFLTIHRRLKMLLGIIHDLDLTTRIWSKS